MDFKIIAKAHECSDDYNTFTAIIMEPDTVDLHGDITSEEEIRKACHKFMKKRELNTGIQHIKVTDKLAIVQCYVTDEPRKIGNKEIKKGSWIGVFEPLNDQLKKEIKEERFNGVSIKGVAATEDIESNIQKEANQNIDNNIQKSIENPYKDKPKRRLSNIDVDEISVVDQPANNIKIVSFQKNKGADVKIKFEDIKKAFEEDNELLEQVKKELGEIKKEPKTTEDIYKSLTPDLAEIFKAQQNRLVELEKAANEEVRKSFVNKVTEIKKYANADDNLADALITVSKAYPEQYKLIEKSLYSAIDTIQKSENFAPVGADNPEDLSTNSTEEKVDSITKQLMKADPKLTKEQAISKVYKEQLYK
jgi:hypothetical protein